MTAEQLEELLGKVTQGEWANGNYDYVSDEVEISGFDGEYVASIDCDGCYDALTGPQIDANATLIALAPSLARRVIAAEKLVEALEQCLGEMTGNMDGDLREDRDGRDMAREALTAYRDASK